MKPFIQPEISSFEDVIMLKKIKSKRISTRKVISNKEIKILHFEIGRAKHFYL